MKRWICLLTTLMMLLALPGLAEQPTMLERADALAAELPGFATMELYGVLDGGLFDPGAEEAIAQAAAMTWREPVATVYLSADMEQAIAEERGQGVEVDTDMLAFVEPMLAPAIGNAVVASVSGDSWTAMTLSNVLASDTRYNDPTQPDGAMVFLRFYEDGAPVIFSVNATGGAVVMTCCALMEVEEARAVVFTQASGVTVIPAEEAGQPLAVCRSAADVQAWLDAGERGFVKASDEPAVLPLAGMTMTGGTLTENVMQLAAETGRRMGVPAMAMQTDVAEINQRLSEWAAVDYAAPCMMLTAQPDLKTFAPMVWGSPAYPLLDAGDERIVRTLEESLHAQMFFGLVARQRDVQTIAAVSMSSFAGLWADPAMEDGTGMALLLYEDADCAMFVSWSARAGVVTLQSMCLPLPELARCETATEAALFLAGRGMPLKLTEIPLN